jgi:hypothetical protein
MFPSQVKNEKKGWLFRSRKQASLVETFSVLNYGDLCAKLVNDRASLKKGLKCQTCQERFSDESLKFFSKISTLRI